MKKEEMEQHRAAYQRLVAEAEQRQQGRQYEKAIELALAAGEHVDGMMQYEKKYASRQLVRISAVDFVLKHAPLVLYAEGLDKLERLLDQCTRIERDTCADYRDELGQARARMWQNHRLWDYLERNTQCGQDAMRQVLGGDQDEWRGLAETWASMGLVGRSPEGSSYRIFLAKPMDESVNAKCPSCGKVVEGVKVQFLEPLPCSSCAMVGLFVMMQSDSSV